MKWKNNIFRPIFSDTSSPVKALTWTLSVRFIITHIYRPKQFGACVKRRLIGDLCVALLLQVCHRRDRVCVGVFWLLVVLGVNKWMTEWEKNCRSLSKPTSAKVMCSFGARGMQAYMSSMIWCWRNVFLINKVLLNKEPSTVQTFLCLKERLLCGHPFCADNQRHI